MPEEDFKVQAGLVQGGGGILSCMGSGLCKLRCLRETRVNRIRCAFPEVWPDSPCAAPGGGRLAACSLPALGGRCALPGLRPWCPYLPCLCYLCLSPSANRNSHLVSCRRHACAATPLPAEAACLAALLSRGLQPLPSPSISLFLATRQRWAPWHCGVRCKDLSEVIRHYLTVPGAGWRTGKDVGLGI